jgi:hypothetical protein
MTRLHTARATTVWRAIQSRFSWRALATDIAFCGALGCVGDLVCQYGAEGRRTPAADEWRWRGRGDAPHDEALLDPRRLASVTVFTAVYLGGLQHFILQVYPFVARAFARRLVAPGYLRTQLLQENTFVHAHFCGWTDNIHCAVAYIPAYFVGVGLLQGDSLAATISNVRTEWWSTYLSCTLFWVPFMSMNFLLVPPRRRVQAMACGDLLWCVAIDHIAHRNQQNRQLDERPVI